MQSCTHSMAPFCSLVEKNERLQAEVARLQKLVSGGGFSSSTSSAQSTPYRDPSPENVG